MSLRRPHVARISLHGLAACCLLLPIVLTASSAEKPQFRERRAEAAFHDDASSLSQVAGFNDGASEKKSPQNSLRKTNTETASAIATLAPAIESAVRAPSLTQRTGKSAGLSSLLHARSLRDWEVEDFVLLATVDGSIHARDRNTGAPRWSVEVDNPMVQTVYHRENKSSPEDHRPEDDFLWIVEPSRDGDIYIYDQRRGAGLQRLRLTVKKLAEELSPYAGEDPAVVYTAEKKTTLYTVDAGTGKFTKTFGPRGSTLVSGQRCPQVNQLEGGPDAEKCGSSGSLILGRSEYTVGIQHRDSAEPICTLTYSEWTPNNRDIDLQREYTSTKDKQYVYSLHDGRVLGLDHGRVDGRPNKYNQKLPSPVVRVFDVARPLSVEADPNNAQLIILPQPMAPAETENGFAITEDRNRIFINQTETGSWYAMSEMTYPLVAGGAPKAKCYDSEWLDLAYSQEQSSWEQRQSALVGVHSLTDGVGSGEKGFLAISGPSSAELDAGSGPVESTLIADSTSVTHRAAATPAADILTVITVIVSTLLLTAFVNYRAIVKLARRYLDSKFRTSKAQEPLTPVPHTPIVTDFKADLPASSVEDKVSDSEMKQDSQLTPTRSRNDTLLEPPNGRSRSSTIDRNRGRSRTGPRVRIVEPSPSPGPPGEDDEGEGAGEAPTKKKARRGCRGGAKHKKKKSITDRAEEPDPSVEQAVAEVLQIAKEPSALQPDVAEVNGMSNPADVSGPIIQIGHLKVFTDTVLGFGSHGTVVYKGSFGGRDVAVKRMLLEFYDIASHEVGLLQESDDHPNVIRYFDKESAGEFLYIALELCPASLQDVIEKPSAYSDLLGPSGLDLPDCLKQIAAGVRHLHSLKIVHRDIKPQNILVSAPKRLPSNPNMVQPPRLLISDFGLCKKLEGDQSSFRATTAHAAGTSGWRAPELLVDEDADSVGEAPIAGPLAHSHSDLVVVDTQTNRRATRAIDIFSLGCVFYYVLTGGSHPFDRDGKYMREANIVKGNYSLSELDRLGDYQWEAKDLISTMLDRSVKIRPDAATVLTHPFFWSPQIRLDFLCHVSDQFEFEPRDPPSAALLALEGLSSELLESCGRDFLRPLPREFKDTLGKQRKYMGHRILDLLRALRNKKNHYEDMPEHVKEKVGPLPDGYLGFWTRRFPGLLMGCHRVVKELHWEEKDRFKSYYAI